MRGMMGRHWETELDGNLMGDARFNRARPGLVARQNGTTCPSEPLWPTASSCLRGIADGKARRNPIICIGRCGNACPSKAFPKAGDRLGSNTCAKW